MNKKSISIVALLLGLLILLSVIAYQFARMNVKNKLTQENQTESTLPAPSVKPKFSLLLLTENPTVAVGQTGTILVSTGTPIAGLTAGSIEIKFDPALLEIVDVENGNLWTDANVLEKTINNETGIIRYSVGKGLGLKEDTIGTTVTSFQYKTKIAGVTTISLQPTTKLIRTSTEGPLESDISTITITVQ